MESIQLDLRWQVDGSVVVVVVIVLNERGGLKLIDIKNCDELEFFVHFEE